MRLALKTINKEIQKHFPQLELVKGEGYFYFISDDVDIYGLDSTSIYCYKLNDLSLNSWISEAENVDKKLTEYKRDKTPITNPNRIWL